jgi:hypothetical protein
MRALRIRNPERILEKLYEDLISELGSAEILEADSEMQRPDEEKIVQRFGKAVKRRKSTKTLTSYM